MNIPARSILFEESNHQRVIEFTVTRDETHLLIITNTVSCVDGSYSSTNIFLSKGQLETLREFLKAREI